MKIVDYDQITRTMDTKDYYDIDTVITPVADGMILTFSTDRGADSVKQVSIRLSFDDFGKLAHVMTIELIRAIAL